MKILVTGSNGLVGSKLTDLFLQQREDQPKFELIASGKGPNRHPRQSGYRYLETDVTRSEPLKLLLQHEPIDCIIHTAAMTNVDACERDPAQCNEINALAVKQIAQLCAENRIHLVHLSTDFIFDGLNAPYREEDEPNPLSFYGRAKLDAEQFIADAGCSASILRTVLVYGVAHDPARSNVVLWAREALRKGQAIRVVQDQWRMPTLAEDVALACLQAALRKAVGTFHVAGPELFSIHELVREVAEFWRLPTDLITPVDSEELGQIAPRPRNTAFILDKARRELSYRPRSLREGLRLLDRQLGEINPQSS